MTLSSPFCRIGSKRPLKSIIEKHAPKDFNTYVEPFIGAGHIYFHLTNPNIKSYINDKDKLVVDGYKLLKSNLQVTPADIEKYENMSIEDINKFVKTSPTKPIDKLMKIIYIQCNTFGSTGKGEIFKPSTQVNKLKKLSKYYDFLKNTTITNNDYKTMFKYDKPSTFYFLDPPYEKSKGLYKNSEIDYIEMAKILQSLKGKFILTINDSPEIRNIFNKFNIIKITVKARGNEGIGKDDRTELIIKNY